MEGKGIFHQAHNNSTYDGEWQNGLMHGSGIITSKKGKKCTVVYKHNKRIHMKK
jgi:hypothetical protein